MIACSQYFKYKKHIINIGSTYDRYSNVQEMNQNAQADVWILLPILSLPHFTILHLYF